MSALSLHDALPILFTARQREALLPLAIRREGGPDAALAPVRRWLAGTEGLDPLNRLLYVDARVSLADEDRKSTRLNSSHLGISYAVFCLKKKNGKRPRLGRIRCGRQLRAGLGSPPVAGLSSRQRQSHFLRSPRRAPASPSDPAQRSRADR